MVGGQRPVIREIEPVVEGTGVMAGEGGAKEGEKSRVGDVLFAEAEAGVGGGGLGIGAGGGVGVGRVVRVFQGVGIVRGLDVDEVEAGGVTVLDELAEADFGGVGDEAEHGLGDEDAGEDDAEEGASEAGAGGW